MELERYFQLKKRKIIQHPETSGMPSIFWDINVQGQKKNNDKSVLQEETQMLNVITWECR